ncbi:hypothetical protein NGA_2063420, partial [Nannochloropsis gaditana CCMP526]|uniref:uncharacterized protein n=1 Tax=Nannochloropsis gaditana (strain CCMP526) TaxID=1093141 RepID=UPI00029F6B7A
LPLGEIQVHGVERHGVDWPQHKLGLFPFPPSPRDSRLVRLVELLPQRRGFLPRRGHDQPVHASGEREGQVGEFHLLGLHRLPTFVAEAVVQVLEHAAGESKYHARHGLGHQAQVH